MHLGIKGNEFVMILEDDKKRIILKRLKITAIKKILVILATSFAFGLIAMLIITFTSDDMDMRAYMMIFVGFSLFMFILHIDDFMIAICMLFECMELKKADTEYFVVTASEIRPSPWPFHLGSRFLNRKKAIYEYEEKKRSRLLWADIMVKAGDFRLLVLVPKNKPKHIYAFALVNFLDVYG